jgi:ABC-type phosphate transport system substrate-binding protein
MKIHFWFGMALLFLAFFGAISVPAANAEMAVILHPDVQENPGEEEIREIFLGRKTRWDSGEGITFVVLKDGEVHTEFMRRIVQKTPSQFQTYWRKMVFTGKGRAPESFDSPEEMAQFVAATPGAIGYVPSSASADGTRKIEMP